MLWLRNTKLYESTAYCITILPVELHKNEKWPDLEEQPCSSGNLPHELKHLSPCHSDTAQTSLNFPHILIPKSTNAK